MLVVSQAPLPGAPLPGAPLQGAPLQGAPLPGAPLQENWPIFHTRMHSKASKNLKIAGFLIFPDFSIIFIGFVTALGAVLGPKI